VRAAAIDIGTNSTRLLVAELDRPDGDLVTLDRRMTITRLGQGVDASRALAPEAITRTVDALRTYRSAIDAIGDVGAIRATATSAARDATNREEFFAAASDALGGVTPELLPGSEEARLSFLGATAGLDAVAPGPYLVVDIGGGSTEFVVGTDAPEGLLSVDIGCVRLTETWLRSDPPTAEELSQAVHVVREHLADVLREVPAVTTAKTLVGLAGTVSTFAMVEQGLAEYDRDKVHHFRLTKDAAEDVFRTLATEPAAARRHNPGLEPGRVDVIVGGAVILVSVLRTFGFDEMLTSEADILDGLIRDVTDG
jgi:exopolyphosphatase/guanosine-5'-triphosphate,3'-diphosphate pyrophosphatase